jgi:large repetitive protein
MGTSRVQRGDATAPVEGFAAPALVEHDGKLVAFAWEEGEPVDRLYFRVLDPQDPEAATSGRAAWSGWFRHDFPERVAQLPHNQRQLREAPPPEVRLAGMDLLTVTPAAHHAEPAAAPFAVVSVDPYLHVFRQSAHGTLYLDRFRLVASTERRGSREETVHRLERAWEVRYQRSRLRDVPASDTDTQSAVDMTGVPFHEPTLEFAGVSGIDGGAFGVARVPTTDPERAVWYVAVNTGDAVRLHAIRQSTESVADFSEPVWQPPALVPSVDGVGTLPPLAGLQPALTLYAERGPARGRDGEHAELEQGARLMLAVPVGGADGPLPRATAVYDFGIDRAGRIPTLAPEDQACVLADGTIEDGTFVPDHDASSYPSGDAAADAVRVIDGLTVQSVVLGQVQPHTSPTLRSGEDGLVHLYYGGPDPTELPAWGALDPGVPQGMVAQFDPRVSRLTVAVGWQQLSASEQPAGSVRFVARQAGPKMRGATIAVSDVTFGSGDGAQPQPDLCEIVVSCPEGSGLPNETWSGVPRDVRVLPAVLGGGASDDAADPAVADGQTPFFDFSGTRPVVRIPLALDGDAGEDDRGRPRLTLATSRADLPLAAAEVTANGDAVDLTLRFAPDGPEPVTAAFAGLPAHVAAWVSILTAEADASTFDYTALDGTTAVFGLPTTAVGVDAPVLLYAEGAHVDVMTVAAAPDAAHPGRLTVTFTPQGDGDRVDIDDVPADVDGFAATLRDDAAFGKLGFGISTSGAGGDVAVTDGPQGRMDLRDLAATVFDTIRPDVALDVRSAVTGTHPAGTLRRTVVGGDSAADPARLTSFAVAADQPESGAGAVIVDHEADPAAAAVDRILAARADAGAAQGGGWIREDGHAACAFDGTDAMAVPVVVDGGVAPASRNLRPQPRWTLESWVEPSGSGLQRLVTFRDAETAVPAHAPALDYRVGLKGQETLRFQSYPKGGAPDSSFLVTGTTNEARFMRGGSFTWEFWVQPEQQAAPTGSNPTPIGGVIQVKDPSAGQPCFSVGLTADRHVLIRTSDGGNTANDYTSSVALPYESSAGYPSWSHVAVVGVQDGEGGPWHLRLYVDADLVDAFDDVTLVHDLDYRSLLTIGCSTFDGASVFGKVALLTYWAQPRTRAELRREAFSLPSGAENGLLGCWPLAALEPGGPTGRYARNTALLTGSKWDASLHEFKQPVGMVEDTYFLSVVASVGGLPLVEAPAMLATGRWNHVAVTYEAGGALRLNLPGRPTGPTGDWARCAVGDDLEAGQSFAIDVWLAATPNEEGAVISRWSWGQDPDDQSYKLEVDSAGHLVLTVALIDNPRGGTKTVVARSSEAVLAGGEPRHVAVVFAGQSGDPTNEDPKGSYTITFYADNRNVGSVTGTVGVADLEVQASRAPVYIGRGVAIPDEAEDGTVEDLALFSGTIGRLRFWGGAPQVRELFPEHYREVLQFGPPRLLAAQWDFTEGEGHIADDPVGGNDASLSSPEVWGQLEETSQLRCYANGALVLGAAPYDGDLPPAAGSTFTLGKVDGDATDGLTGKVAQVTLWQDARSRPTIATQMRTPRSGDEAGLVAGWNFRDGAGVDITGGGNNADPALASERCGPSGAPITIEGAIVRNVYGGAVTQYSHSTPGRLAVAGYVDVAGAGSATPTVALLRDYLLDPDASPLEGVYVGTLGLVYLGQQQTKPELIGFIEGAPPVPSEDLTRPGGDYPTYRGTSSVTVGVQDSYRITYRSSTRHSTNLDVSGALGVFGLSQKTGITSPIIYKDTLEVKNSVQLTAKAGFNWNDQRGLSYTGTWSSAQSDTQRLSGDWEPFEEDPARYLNPQVGRRFLPANTGVGVVESLTADVYVTVCKATGASLGTVVLPNLDIPPDRNLVVFPIADRYTKNGTLDGKVGLANDPSYPDADAKRGSYFKPNEAYALAADVEQQHARDQGKLSADDHQQVLQSAVSGSGLSEDLQAALQPLSERLPVAFAGDPADGRPTPVPRTGIVNRYVWTAQGGLHRESESYAGAASRSYQGSFGFDVGGGLKGQGEFFVFSLGLSWGLDVSAGYAFDVQTGGEDATEAAVTLDIDVQGESYLRAGAPGGGDGHPPPVPAGKVSQYRFMSYYLPPSKRNGAALSGVVDPVWLALSNDPAARAMRELDTSNPAWRVLHRVTYVERTPPRTASHPLATAQAVTPTPVNVEGNLDLLRLVDAQVGGTRPVTPAVVGAAVAAVLNPPSDGGGGYPRAVLEETVPWWGDFLAAARPGPNQDDDAAALLHRLMVDTVAYCVHGYRTAVLPLPTS